MSAVPLIPAAGAAATCVPDRLQCVRDRELDAQPRPAAHAASPAFTLRPRPTAKGQERQFDLVTSRHSIDL